MLETYCVVNCSVTFRTVDGQNKLHVSKYRARNHRFPGQNATEAANPIGRGSSRRRQFSAAVVPRFSSDICDVVREISRKSGLLSPLTTWWCLLTESCFVYGGELRKSVFAGHLGLASCPEASPEASQSDFRRSPKKQVLVLS